MSRIRKAIKHLFIGNDKGEGGIQARCGNALGVLAALFGPIPAQVHPDDYNEGLGLKVVDIEINPRAVETAVFTVPKGAMILMTEAIVKTLLVAGGTSVTWSLGTAATPAKYGSAGAPTQADSLLKNSKMYKIAPLDTQGVLAADEPIVLTAAATGGAADGDTAFTAGTVRVVIHYWEAQPLKSYV